MSKIYKGFCDYKMHNIICCRSSEWHFTWNTIDSLINVSCFADHFKRAFNVSNKFTANKRSRFIAFAILTFSCWCCYGPREPRWPSSSSPRPRPCAPGECTVMRSPTLSASHPFSPRRQVSITHVIYSRWLRKTLRRSASALLMIRKITVI